MMTCRRYVLRFDAAASTHPLPPGRTGLPSFVEITMVWCFGCCGGTVVVVLVVVWVAGVGRS